MGILDDAIREHLELKRQHGADNDDIDRLEKEAFGPPTRPGDPEFDTSEGQPAAGVEDAGPQASPAAREESPVSEEAPSRGGLFDAEAEGERDEDWLASLEDAVEQPPPAPSESGSAATEQDEADSPASPIEDVSPAERARVEYSDLDDTVDHPAVSPPETGEEPSAPPAPETGEEDATAAPAEAPEAAIFDQDDDVDFGDLDLDLDDAELDADEPAPRGAGPATSTEMDALPPAPVEPITGEEDYVADEQEEDDLEDDEDDLLEETPDFLQDAPEGERLWFEQGAPKDFDFDDEDEED